MIATKRIVCLANSRKLAGRCIAGREWSTAGAGDWVRPVSKREHGDVGEYERQYEDGTKPACGVEYVHAPDLAPTANMLKAYRAGQMDWATYERRFLDLMRERRIEETLPKRLIADGCLLCSEDQPHHCHRRLVAEYLRDHWGSVDIEHLGSRAAG